MVKGGHTPGFVGHLGVIGKTRPRNVPALAPHGLKINSDALARHPQPMQSAHTVCFFGHGIGADGAATQEGAKGSSLLTAIWGDTPPRIY